MTKLRPTGGLRVLLAICLWLLLNGLLLLLFVQAYELSRSLGHLLVPTDFEQEVASRARPMLISNSVLVLGAILWLGAVIITMNRLLSWGQNQTKSGLRRFCARWFGTSAALLALLWLANRGLNASL